MTITYTDYIELFPKMSSSMCFLASKLKNVILDIERDGAEHLWYIIFVVKFVMYTKFHSKNHYTTTVKTTRFEKKETKKVY